LTVILASASPRRRELLSEVLPHFEVLPSRVDEESITVADPWKTARNLAEAKARAVATLRPDAIVIGADTVVALPLGESYIQLAKPLDQQDAVRMLQLLSGRTHHVITGVAFVIDGAVQVLTETSNVRFRELDPGEIASYVETGEPMDKAGGYAIQAGAKDFVAQLNGSLTNVIGLPMERVRPVIDSLALL
jgi:septum formation protein